jgi:hypothetical protein
MVLDSANGSPWAPAWTGLSATRCSPVRGLRGAHGHLFEQPGAGRDSRRPSADLDPRDPAGGPRGRVEPARQGVVRWCPNTGWKPNTALRSSSCPRPGIADSAWRAVTAVGGPHRLVLRFDDAPARQLGGAGRARPRERSACHTCWIPARHRAVVMAATGRPSGARRAGRNCCLTPQVGPPRACRGCGALGRARRVRIKSEALRHPGVFATTAPVRGATLVVVVNALGTEGRRASQSAARRRDAPPPGVR